MIVVKNYHNAGFSIIELITVIVLLGILSVYALGSLGNQNAFAARGIFDDTVVAVRFAQKFAISSGCAVRVVTTANTYVLSQRNSCALGIYDTAVDNPANRNIPYQNLNIPAEFTLTAGTITFDAKGVRQEATSAFTLTGGPTILTFTVHAATGLVSVP